ncbi:hypothetical protein BT69DRAFT_1318137, partial [Atractiella rhizophila]
MAPITLLDLPYDLLSSLLHSLYLDAQPTVARPSPWSPALTSWISLVRLTASTRLLYHLFRHLVFRHVRCRIWGRRHGERAMELLDILRNRPRGELRGIDLFLGVDSGVEESSKIWDLFVEEGGVRSIKLTSAAGLTGSHYTICHSSWRAISMLPLESLDLTSIELPFPRDETVSFAWNLTSLKLELCDASTFALLNLCKNLKTLDIFPASLWYQRFDASIHLTPDHWESLVEVTFRRFQRSEVLQLVDSLQTAKSAGIQHKLSSFTLISKETIPHTDTRALLSLLPSTLYTLQLIGLSSIPISSLSHLTQLSNLEFTDSVLLHPSLPLPPSIPLKKLTIC